MVACYMYQPNGDIPASTGGPSTPAMLRPHQDKGVNVLYSDGSVRWVTRPNHIAQNKAIGFVASAGFPQTAPGWPHQNSMALTVEGGNNLDNDNFWLWVNQMY